MRESLVTRQRVACGWLAAALTLAGSAPWGAAAEARVALVIGCGEYGHAPRLPNPGRDAAAVRSLLERLGFSVIYLADPGVEQFYDGLERFGRAAGSARVGLFYYAGHGIEVEGQNYMLPVDAILERESQLRTQAIGVETVLQEMDGARLPAKLIILDCCRDNPLTRSWLGTRGVGSGLAGVEDRALPAATMIMYAAAPGHPALDGEGGNSPFTAALLSELGRPGVTAMDAFLAVSDTVAKSTGERQVPWIKFDGAGRAFRQFGLAGEAGGPAAPAAGAAPAPPTPVAAAVPAPTAAGTPAVQGPAGATKERPFVNSLGMEFVPVPGTGVLCCRWETRVRDFDSFVTASGYKPEARAYSMKSGSWGVHGADWREPGFPQTAEHPVTCVNWYDANAFCDWLTSSERTRGIIGPNQRYRLPTAKEWETAAGTARYPWGSSWPPGTGEGNFGGSEMKVGELRAEKVIEDYRDAYPHTAPARELAENGIGIAGLGGNLWEWCADAHPTARDAKVLKGGSWFSCEIETAKISFPGEGLPGSAGWQRGFRVLLDPGE